MHILFRMTKRREICGLFDRIRKIFSTLAEYRYTTVAGALVFFLIMSLVPFFFWLVLLFGRNLPAEAVFALQIFDWAKELLHFVHDHVEGAATGASLFLIGATLWSSTGFFYHLRRIGEIIYGERRKKHGWKVRLSAAAITLCQMLFFAAAGGIVLGASLWLRKLSAPIYCFVVYLLVFVFGIFAAWMLNAYLCPYRTRPSDTFLGSLITAAAWLIASVAFSVYLMFGDKSKLYGALSAVIVFFLWLYWMMICLVAGAVFNCTRFKQKQLIRKKF